MASADTTAIDPERAHARARRRTRFMAECGNRAGGWPTLSVAHGPDDVDRYVATFDDFLTEVT